jgi:hypothetical protein
MFLRCSHDGAGAYPSDIAVAYGQPWPYADMLAWCQANVAAGAWPQHGNMDWNRRDDNGAPTDFSRWYFMSDADAEVFRQRWVTNGKERS